jgi:arsenite/tail-anchored protein-transporting ATPase
MQRRLTLVIGKGGVGKTTVARGFAERAARESHRPLVMEFDGDPGSRMPNPASFDLEVADGNAALRSVAAEILGSRRLAGALLSHAAIRQLATVVPGLREVALLVVAMRHLETGRHIIVDMPATGHGLAWFDTVRLLGALQPSGRARSLIEEVDAMLADRELTKIVVVTLGERLVINETRELCRALPRPPDLVVINGVHRPPQIPADVLAAVGQLPGRAAATSSLRRWLTPSERLPEFGEATCEVMRYPRAPTPPEIARVLDREVGW